MLKSATASLLIYAILTVSLTIPLSAQQNEVPAKEAADAKTTDSGVDLKDAFARETARVKADSAVFDPVKTERENANQQAQKKGWSKGKKTLVIVAVAAGIAALTFLLIKYYRKCLRYSTNCYYDPNTGQEDCPCEEYEPRDS
jgi:hypothetical protein